MEIGIAILGVGRWGVHWVRNFQHHPQAKVVAIVDSQGDRLTFCQQKFALHEDVVLATSWEDIRELSNLNAVVIATPASTHYSLIRDALNRGYHVLGEKPLTLNPQECLELTKLAAEQQCQLLVDHTYLFNPVVERGKEVMDSGVLGELRYGYGTRTHLGPVRQDVDALWDLAIHDICIFNHWLGETPQQVKATGKVWLQENHKMKLDLPLHPGLVDMVWVTLMYPSGFEASIHLCWSNPDKQRRLCVVGSQGTLIFNEMLSDTPLILQKGYFEREGERFLPAGQAEEIVDLKPGEPLGRVCDRFLQAITIHQDITLSSGKVGAELVQVLRCLSQSLQEGGTVIAVPEL